MVQGRSTKIISMIKWIRTSRLSIKISLSVDGCCAVGISDVRIPPSGCERPFDLSEVELVIPGVLDAESYEL